MSITPITAKITKSPNSIKIFKSKNTDEFLYNKVLKIVRDCKAPATFKNEHIDLPSPTKNVLDNLNEQGIHFDEIV